jgi:hypothetical protein
VSALLSEFSFVKITVVCPSISDNVPIAMQEGVAEIRCPSNDFGTFPCDGSMTKMAEYGGAIFVSNLIFAAPV